MKTESGEASWKRGNHPEFLPVRRAVAQKMLVAVFTHSSVAEGPRAVGPRPVCRALSSPGVFILPTCPAMSLPLGGQDGFFIASFPQQV